MMDEPQPPPAPAPRPLSLLLGDEWEAGQPNRRRITVVAALIGMALIVTFVVLLRRWEPNDERVLVPLPAPPAPFAMPPDSGLHAERVAGTLRPPRLRPTPHIVERAAPAANRRAAYLSINSSPWAELSVDGHVVGSTPQVRVRVTPGRHHLLLVREGFRTHSAWVTVPTGGTVRITDITLAEITP